MGDVLVEAIDVITGLFVDDVADFAAFKVVQGFGWSGSSKAFYRLQARPVVAAQRGEPCPRIAAGRIAPALVVVHGTFSGHRRHT
jgi:hypothetical protein